MKTICKILLFTLPALLFTSCEWFGENEPDPNDPVNIPDTLFLYALIDKGVDTNGDSLISYHEAEAVKSLIYGGCSPVTYGELMGVTSLTGIESFINLDTLITPNILAIEVLDLTELTKLKFLDVGGGVCGCCKKSALYPPGSLHSLDISTCTGLKTLICDHTSLSNLDVSNCPLLEKLWFEHCDMSELDISNNQRLLELDCHGNSMNELDVSGNTSLEYLRCGGNELNSLDLTNNLSLKELEIEDGQLSSLNISTNNALEKIKIRVSNLYEVCVWTVPFPPEGIEVNTDDSPNVCFTTECSTK